MANAVLSSRTYQLFIQCYDSLKYDFLSQQKPISLSTYHFRCFQLR